MDCYYELRTYPLEMIPDYGKIDALELEVLRADCLERVADVVAELMQEYPTDEQLIVRSLDYLDIPTWGEFRQYVTTELRAGAWLISWDEENALVLDQGNLEIMTHEFLNWYYGR